MKKTKSRRLLISLLIIFITIIIVTIILLIYCSKKNTDIPYGIDNLTIYTNEYTIVEFGSYPQTIVDDQDTIKQLNKIRKTNKQGYIEYNGNEYAKIKADYMVYEDYKPIFSNNQPVVNGETYYFKVEPIKWRRLIEQTGTYKLMTNIILDNPCFYKDTSEREIDGRLIAPNNYEYSNIRAWLNGYNGSMYNVDDYTNKGFYNLAFNNNEKSIILNTVVTNINILNNDYNYTDTFDKLYLLSEDEIFNKNYFNNIPHNIKEISDYAIAKGVVINRLNENDIEHVWRLRTPNYSLNNSSLTIYDNIEVKEKDEQKSYQETYQTYCGCVIALSIRIYD